MANRKARNDQPRHDNERTRDRRDEYDEDLALDNRANREGGRIADLAAESDRSPAGLAHFPPEGGKEHVQHSRQGQAQSPRELNHNEPPRHKEGHR